MGYTLVQNRLKEISSLFHQSVGGIMVSIAAFQAVDPGSIPGRRKKCFFSLYCFEMFFPEKNIFLSLKSEKIQKFVKLRFATGLQH